MLENRIAPAGQPLLEPPVIRSDPTTRVLTATLTEAVGPAIVGDTQVVNAWTYNGSYAGPTLIANPGDLLDLVVVNNLPGQPTNLHTHGLHVSPIGNADNVLLIIEPGESNHYRIQIPANHPQGLYWYHPHEHGVVNEQISRGLSGMLVIGRPDGGAPELNGLTQHLLTLKNALLEGNQITVPAEGSDHKLQTFTVNGQLQPVVTMRPNEWQVFNVVNAGNDAFYIAQLSDTANPKSSMEMLAVAADGNPFTKVGNPQQEIPGLLGFPPGRRWSFLVHAPANPSPGQQFVFQSVGFQSVTGGVPDPTNQWPAVNLLTIQFAGPPVIGGPTFANGTRLSPPNNAFHDLRLVPAAQIAERRTVLFGRNGMMELINGAQFPNNPIFQPRLNTVEEWTLVNPTSEDHPFHLHTNPMQVIGSPIDPNRGGLPIFFDVIMVPAGKTTRIRVEFKDFLGEHVYHCHRVDHEDDGMMALVNIIAERPVYATAAGSGGDPQVNVYDARNNMLVTAFNAYDPAFRGGVAVAVGDVNMDAIPDYITAAGPGGGPHVKAFSGKDGALLYSFMAYDPLFHGGVFVAAGDVNGDGFADILTGAGAGGGPHVKAFSGKDGSLLQSFFAYDPAFTGGARVAAGDINGDGRIEIITGAGPGGGPHVQVFNGIDLTVMASFFAYDLAFRGGVFVGTGNGKGRAFNDIITGAGFGGGPQVRVFSNQPTMSGQGDDAASPHAADELNLVAISSFFAYDPAFRGGVAVAALHRTDRDDFVTGPGQGGGPDVRIFNGRDPSQLVANFDAFDPRFRGGVFGGGAG